MRLSTSSAADVALALKQIHGRRSKYGNRKTTVDGIVFDSAKEAKRWQELRLLEKAGEIREIVRQPRFVLWAHTGIVADAPVVIGEYVADFAYETKDGADVFEDVKGVKTPLYRWKKKHVEAQYGITILET